MIPMNEKVEIFRTANQKPRAQMKDTLSPGARCDLFVCNLFGVTISVRIALALLLMGFS